MRSIILRVLTLLVTSKASSLATETVALTSAQISTTWTRNSAVDKRSPAFNATLTPVSYAPSSAQSALSSALPAQEPGKPPEAKLANLSIPDDGWKFGNVMIYNWCSGAVYIKTVGAHYQGGPRDGSKVGWGTPEDEVYHTIPSGNYYTESYRASGGCAYTGAPPYCPDEDKLAGQGISIKISKSNDPADQEITQLEYALYQNPNTGDTFKKLYYDVSLLDCGTPDVAVTDFDATEAMYTKKSDVCPGYDGGVAVTFDGDEEGAICPPIYCDGKSKCFMIYTFDRTRPQESSFTCEKEYKGNLRLDLCVSEGGAKVQDAAVRFSSWAQTATHEVLMLQLGRTTPAVGGSPSHSTIYDVPPSSLQPASVSSYPSSVGVAATPPNVVLESSSVSA